MIREMRWMAAAVAMAIGTAAVGAGELVEEPTLEARAVKAAWEFSADGGKTFAKTAPEKATELVAKATFTVEDPAAVAGLWVSHEDPKIAEQFPAGMAACGFAMAGPREARDKSCGATPLWTYTKVQLNGKPVAGPQEAMVYVSLPLEPAGLLVKGTNTLTVSGTLWSLGTRSKPAPVKPLKLIAAPPQVVPLRGGPLVGMIADGGVAIHCATPIPASVSMTATPIEPAGPDVTAVSPVGLYHAVKLPLPAGTRTFRYRLVTKAGSQESKASEFTATLPAADGKGFKVVAMGNTRCHGPTVNSGPKLAAGMLARKPDVFVHVGQVVELATWDWHWERFFFDQYRPLVSAVPTYLSPDGGDHIGRCFRAFGMPDDRPHNWTRSFGEVRLIGCDGAYEWKAGDENAKWLESVLQGAKEKYIIVFDHFPGYTDGYQSSPHGGAKERTFGPIKQCREVILPMLGKYKATALVSAFDYNYERLEPTPDKGVTCIIVGAGGAKTYCQGAACEFTSTAKWLRITSFVEFAVKGDSCEMTAVSIDGETIDSKTFKPRQ